MSESHPSSNAPQDTPSHPSGRKTSSTNSSKKPPAFYCPACGRKHRAPVHALKDNPAARLRATCAQCAVPMSVGMKPNGELFTERLEEMPASPVQETSSRGATSSNTKSPPKVDGKETSPKATPLSGLPVKPSVAKGKSSRGTRTKSRTTGSRTTGSRAKKGSLATRKKPVPQRDSSSASDDDRYRLEDQLHEGSTTEVFRAFDASTKRFVALKMLKHGVSETIQQRFLREIEAQANIRHPNIMPVFDRGTREDGRSYFTMELLHEPQTLRLKADKLTQEEGSDARRPLELRELQQLVKDVMVPISKGIYVANVENGVVHRDLKPENILIDGRSGRPYVIDFGICDVVESKGGGSQVARAPSATNAGIVGTPRYLPPEQVQGESHPRTDVWGLGAILFYLVAGQPPIAGASNISRAALNTRIDRMKQTLAQAEADNDKGKIELCRSKLERMQDESLRTIEDIVRDAHRGQYVALPESTPSAVAAVIHKAMERAPSNRYVNGRQLASDLEAWLKGSRVRAVSARGGKVAAKADARRAIRRHMTTALMGLAGMGIGGVGAWAMTRDAPQAPSSRLHAADEIVRAAEARLPHIQQRLAAKPLAAAEYTEWSVELDRDLARASTWLADEPATSSVVSLRDRVEHVRRRFAPDHWAIELPPLTSVSVKRVLDGKVIAPLDVPEDDSRNDEELAADKTRTTDAQPKDIRSRLSKARFELPPGMYGASILDGHGNELARIPLVVRLLVRQSGSPARLHRVQLPPELLTDVPEDARRILVPNELKFARSKLDAPFVPLTGFWMARTEVTQDRYLSFLLNLKADEREARVPSVGFTFDDESGRVSIQGESKNGELPVRGVSASDAQAYCTWRAAKMGRACRLPTRLEWRYVAGESLGCTKPNGEWDAAAFLAFDKTVHRVGITSRDEGPMGVRDLLGNVCEICSDGEGHVAMGGASGSPLATRLIDNAKVLNLNQRDPHVGFRLVYPLVQK